MTNPKPQGITWITPYLTVLDINKAANFYQKAFDFEIKELAMGEDGLPCHGEMKYKDQMVMMGKQGAYGSTTKSPISSGVESPMNLYIYCEDVDQFYAHAVEQGATPVVPPADMFWGDRMCQVKDLDGYAWCFATHLGEKK